jgi:hypothetical protein
MRMGQAMRIIARIDASSSNYATGTCRWGNHFTDATPSTLYYAPAAEWNRNRRITSYNVTHHLKSHGESNY